MAEKVSEPLVGVPIVPSVPPARRRGVARGFLDFVRQYGIAPLAIGVVIANAVNDLVKTVVDGLISPLIALISPTTSLQTLQFTVGKSVFKVGAVANSLLSFFLIALVVYLFAKWILRNEEVLKK